MSALPAQASIRFYPPLVANQEYLTTDYFDQMNAIEIIHRLGELQQKPESFQLSRLRSQLRLYYTQRTLVFTDEEKTLIISAFNQMKLDFDQRAPNFFPNRRQIGLIKLGQGIDWNFPYTINHCIILPELYLKKFAKDMPRLKTTLCHELIHLLQRYPNLYPRQNALFNSIITEMWGFQRIRKSQLRFSQGLTDQHLNIMTNPDGANYEWIIVLPDGHYLPTLSRDIHNNLCGNLILLQMVAPQTYQVTLNWKPIAQVSIYVQKFQGLSQQLYHPNEIIAHLITDLIRKTHIVPSSAQLQRLENLILIN
jgi:hypothetical protein